MFKYSLLFRDGIVIIINILLWNNFITEMPNEILKTDCYSEFVISRNAAKLSRRNVISRNKNKNTNKTNVYCNAVYSPGCSYSCDFVAL